MCVVQPRSITHFAAEAAEAYLNVGNSTSLPLESTANTSRSMLSVIMVLEAPLEVLVDEASVLVVPDKLLTRRAISTSCRSRFCLGFRNGAHKMVDPDEKLITSSPKLALTNSLNCFTVSGPPVRIESHADHVHDFEPSGRRVRACRSGVHLASDGRWRVFVLTPTAPQTQK